MNYMTNSFRKEMGRLFEDLWPESVSSWSSSWSPACEIEEDDGHFLITAEMAGIPKDQIKIELRDNQLLISGERHQGTKRKEGGYRYSERRFGKFQRAFSLPTGIDADHVEANYEDGILRLFIPKTDSAKPRQIKISNGSATGFFGRLLGTPKKEKEVKHSSDELKTDQAVA